MLLVMVYEFLRNRNKISSKLLVKLGLDKRVLLSEYFWCIIEELNIVWILLGFFGCVIVNIGMY